jgi:hypothetical protein
LPVSQPTTNADPVGLGRSLWMTSAIAGMTENGERATTVANAVSSPTNAADTRATVRLLPRSADQACVAGVERVAAQIV